MVFVNPHGKHGAIQAMILNRMRGRHISVRIANRLVWGDIVFPSFCRGLGVALYPSNINFSRFPRQDGIPPDTGNVSVFLTLASGRTLRPDSPCKHIDAWTGILYCLCKYW